jgi:hypothetical protein
MIFSELSGGNVDVENLSLQPGKSGSCLRLEGQRKGRSVGPISVSRVGPSRGKGTNYRYRRSYPMISRTEAHRGESGRPKSTCSTGEPTSSRPQPLDARSLGDRDPIRDPHLVAQAARTALLCVFNGPMMICAAHHGM